jgi:hypothetical protein
MNKFMVISQYKTTSKNKIKLDHLKIMNLTRLKKSQQIKMKKMKIMMTRINHLVKEEIA